MIPSSTCHKERMPPVHIKFRPNRWHNTDDISRLACTDQLQPEQNVTSQSWLIHLDGQDKQIQYVTQTQLESTSSTCHTCNMWTFTPGPPACVPRFQSFTKDSTILTLPVLSFGRGRQCRLHTRCIRRTDTTYWSTSRYTWSRGWKCQPGSRRCEEDHRFWHWKETAHQISKRMSKKTAKLMETTTGRWGSGQIKSIQEGRFGLKIKCSGLIKFWIESWTVPSLNLQPSGVKAQSCLELKQDETPCSSGFVKTGKV